MTKAKINLLKLILVVLAFLSAVFLFEILLRLFFPAPENLSKLKSSNVFLQENKPNAVFPYILGGEFDNLISINSHGFRDDEFRVEKGGAFRIAVLGDSQEEALQVALFDTWQKVMARKLSADLGIEVETYNFGVSGYGTDQQWLTLREKVWQFSPDMIILAFSPNDVGDTYKNGLVVLNEGKLEVVDATSRAGGNVLGRSVRETYSYHYFIKAASSHEITRNFAEKVRVKILGFNPEERFFLSDAQLVQGPFEAVASQKNPPEEVEKTWEVIRAIVQDMSKQASANGAEFVITVNIPRAQVNTSDWHIIRDKYGLNPGSSSPYEINEVLSMIAAEAGVDLYDPREDAIEWTKERGELHFREDAHFNKNGNEFMGESVAGFIIENDLIGKSLPN